MKEAGVPIIPGTTDPVSSAGEVVRLGRRDRLPTAHQGGGRRWREGDEGRRRCGRGRARIRVRTPRGRGVLRRLVGLRRAVPRGPAPRRGAGARRCPRQRHPPRRARLHDPAPAPEARRGDTLACGRRRAARPHRLDRGRRGPGGRLPVGGHDRGPARTGRRVLLPRDEHPHPGRAHRHRDGHGPRPRARAGSDRSRRAAVVHPGGRRPARARDRVPDQRGGPVQQGSCRRRGGSRATASRPGLVCGSTPASSQGRRSPACTTR